MANRFLSNVNINDEYTLPSADGTADQIITTDGAGQLSFVDQSTISSGSSEKVVIYAKNTHTASIAKGTPVYITGTVGATDTVQIAPADASNSAKMPAVGLLDETLAVNDFGYVITGGFMDNITTDPIDGGTPSSNDTVYVKSGGGLTLTKPTGSQLIQNIAKVGKVSGGNSGSLIVSSILRTNDVPNLTTGKIWVGSSTYTTESGVVHLDETNNRLGINQTSPIGAVHIVGPNTNPAMTTSALVVEQGDGAKILIDGNDIDAAAGMLYLNDYSTNDVVFGGQIRVGGGGSPVGNSWFANGNVGIGTTSPSEKLDVVGSAQITNDIYLGRYIFHDGDTNTWLGFPLADTISFRTSGSDRMYITSAGNVGVGTTSPRSKLHVEGVTASVPALGAAASAAQIGGSTYGTLFSTLTSGIGVIQQGRSDGAGLTFSLLINPNGGNVGIGTTSASYTLDVDGVIRGEQYLRLADTAGTNRFSIRAESSYSTIDNGTNTLNTIANAHIFLRSTTEIMRIHSNNNVGIGTTSPSAKLNVVGNVDFDPDDFVIHNSSGSYGGRLIAHFRQGADLIQFGDVEGYISGNTFDINYGSSICNFHKMNVGIDNASPSYLLDVNGDGRVDGTFRCVSLIQTSQRDQKTEIELVGKETTSIPIKRYKYKSGDNDKLRYGVVAEDIESNYPELVETDAEGIKGVKYIDLLVRKIAELETEKRTLVNWRHYHTNTSYNTLYDAGMSTAFPYAYGSIPAPYDMYFTSLTLVNNPYSSYNKGPEGDTATVQAYVNNQLVYEIRDIRYGNNPFESITADFGKNVALRQGEALQIRFQANGPWRYCNSTIILTEK